MADETKIAKNDIDNPSLTMELFKEFKKQSRRQNITILVALGVIVFIVTAFLWYLSQYDFVDSINQTGVYTLIDSEGNVISADLSSEEINKIMEVMNNGNNDMDEEPEEKER